jgi:oxalate decarboxylase/phosphoglucose isomerase-like protein (cupin superfamily)
MAGKFVIASEVTPEINDWGKLGWLSNPPNTGARQLTVIDVNLSPGKGHNFHKHPDQEEVILVVSGKVEQWVDREKQVTWSIRSRSTVRPWAPTDRSHLVRRSSPATSVGPAG